uniref:AAA+ ATPase domain-containing protein n=1 Tax=Lotharella globosa TaxID=91324 RepID=A0A7S3ZAF4_9EUKA
MPNGTGGGSPPVHPMGIADPSKRMSIVAENVVLQRQNLSAAIRLFDSILPNLGYDDKLQKASFKMDKEKNLEMLKASQARFGKLRQEKSNMEKELRKLATIERMRVREGARPSQILVDAKNLINEAVAKLDAAIDISEGEFKPLWIESVRENQIIKSEQRAKDALASAYKMLNSHFQSGHVFLPGIFVQLIPQIPRAAAAVENPHVRKILKLAVPLLGSIVGGSILANRVLNNKAKPRISGMFPKLSARLDKFGVGTLLSNLDLFVTIRAARTLAFGLFNLVGKRLGTSAETAELFKEVIDRTAGVLRNLDVVLLATAAYRTFCTVVPKIAPKKMDKMMKKIPISTQSVLQGCKQAGSFVLANSRTIFMIWSMYRVANIMSKAFDGVKSIKVGLPGFRRVEDEEEHQGIKYDLLDVPDVSFDDVAGLANLKNEVTEIVDFLKEGKKYGRVRAKCPKGVLMTGPPGCGKTLLAKAIAGEAGICFLPCVGSDFNSNIAGSGAEKMRSIWQKAEKNAPCILFIDEIDYVGSKRTEGSKGGAEQDRTGLMTVLLAKMDGINSRDDIFVIATSNRLDILDPALLRPGRFDRQVELTLPDTKGRIEVLNVHARDRPFAPNVNLEYIARKTSGFSGAELANVINEAAIHAGRRSSPIIEQQDLESAYHKVILGVAAERKQTLDYRKSVAVHEAGHAVLAMIMKKKFGEDFKTVTQVSILPRSKGSAGVTCFMNPQDEVKRTKSLLEADLTVGLGGRAAEEIWYGKDGIQLGSSSDIESTTSLAHRMIEQEGMSTAVGLVNVNHYSPGDVRKTAHMEVKHLIDTAYEKAKEILRINEVLHRQMVYTLLREETIGEEQLARLAKLYPPAEE